MASSPRKRLLLLALKVAVSAGLVTYFVWKFQRTGTLGRIAERLQHANLWWLLAALGLHVVGTYILSWRWYTLLRAQDLHMPYFALVKSSFVAAFFNNFLPGAVGGDVVRVIDSARHTGEVTRTATVVVLGRVAGLIAQVGTALVAMLVMWRTVMDQLHQNRAVLWSLALLTAGLIAICALAVPAVARVVTKLFGHGPLKKVLGKVLDAIGAYGRRPRHTAIVLLSSFILQANVILYYWIAAKALGYTVPVHQLTMGIAVALTLVMLVPSINALGVRTAAFQLFVFTWMAPADGLKAAAALEVCDLALRMTYGLIGGVIFVLRGQRRKNAECEMRKAE